MQTCSYIWAPMSTGFGGFDQLILTTFDLTTLGRHCQAAESHVYKCTLLMSGRQKCNGRNIVARNDR